MKIQEYYFSILVWALSFISVCGQQNAFPAAATCCCGQFSEIFFPNLDFESGPSPAPGTFFTYGVGTNFGGWTVTQATIDHCHALVGNLGAGNPNGPSFFIDLHGSPGLGGISYNLFGLTPGSEYRIEFWTAQNGSGFSSTGYLKVAGGAWLNVNWIVSVSGAVAWRKEMYEFTAQSSSTTMEFSSTGPMVFAGTLVDDIKIFECPGDTEAPIVLNEPDDLDVECDSDVPPPVKLLLSDNCDVNPTLSLNTTISQIDPCSKIITRNWIIKDACGNSSTVDQNINVVDNTPPDWTVLPNNKIVYCYQDIQKEFNDWIKKNGNANATDRCGKISWRSSPDRNPEKHCDSVVVEFIAKDPCGNESSAYAWFYVKDTTKLKYVIKAKNFDIGNSPNPRDSLKRWLENQGFSKSSQGCDSLIYCNNFKGDSTKNPLTVMFYVKDLCGNIDSTQATFSYQSSMNCCCGTPNELFFSNLDFESPPIAPPGGWIDYSAGSNYAGWMINSGSISIHDPGHLNLGAGNPNGSTQHLDLHGSSQGSASYLLTGLTAGNEYTISFWYAIHSGGANVSAILRVNGGSLLNVSWNASNSGSVIWLPAMYSFIANSSTAAMEFTGTGSTPCCGMLIDDIKIFECVNEKVKPEILNAPDDIEVECLNQVPSAPQILVSDDCDPNPKIDFKETRKTIDPCTIQIDREWTVTDGCGNSTTAHQKIDVIDRTPPIFTKSPVTKIVDCQTDVDKSFNDWIKANGQATATDACGAVSWRSSYDRMPRTNCDTIYSEFIAKDPCGNETSEFAVFYVIDTTAPKYIVSAVDKSFSCISNGIDSLREWLVNQGYSKTQNDCDTVIFSSNFDGDSTKFPVVVTFYSSDRCGNVDSTTATFSLRSSSDTFRITEYSCDFINSTIDTLFYSNQGCDSIVILEKIKTFGDSTYQSFNTCDPQHILFDTIFLTNSEGCDSILFYEFILKETSVDTQQIYDCAFSVYSRDTLILQGQFCDSLIVREFIPLRKDSIVVQQTSCDSANIGIQYFHLTNSFGCDSIVSVITELATTKITLMTSRECGLQNNKVDTLVFNTNNCDSLVITNHMFFPTDTLELFMETCDSNLLGTKTFYHKNQYDCDSLVYVHYSRMPGDSLKIHDTTCDIKRQGIRFINLKNRNGCDSIIQITTFFIPSDTTYISAKTCNISMAGRDTSIYSTSVCDSIVFTEIVFVSSDTLMILDSSCLFSMSGIDSLYFMNAGGCDSIVYIQTEFIPLKLEFELDSISCYGRNDGSIDLRATRALQSPYSVLLNGVDQGQDDVISNLAAGQYQLYVRDARGCLTDTLYFNLDEPKPLSIDLGSDQEVKKNSLVKLNLASSKVLASIIWSPGNLTQCNNCSEIDFIVTQDLWVYALAIDDRGCTGSDSVFIRIKKEENVFVPNVFSPNGDNINDFFYVQGTEESNVEILRIYDRWGNLIFETKNTKINEPRAGWDGSFQGQKMNPGVYIYFAQIGLSSGETVILKGDLTLIR